MNITCPHCGKTIKAKEIAGAFGRLGGQVKSEAKAAAARENGKKGGRPRKITKEITT